MELKDVGETTAGALTVSSWSLWIASDEDQKEKKKKKEGEQSSIVLLFRRDG